MFGRRPDPNQLWRLAHHTQGEGQPHTLPGGTQFRVYPYTGADKMMTEGSPGEFEVHSFQGGDPREWEEYTRRRYLESPEGRARVHRHEYLDKIKTMHESGIYPQGNDWLMDLILRKPGPGM
jgi:hypothetical protein